MPATPGGKPGRTLTRRRQDVAGEPHGEQRRHPSDQGSWRRRVEAPSKAPGHVLRRQAPNGSAPRCRRSRGAARSATRRCRATNPGGHSVEVGRRCARYRLDEPHARVASTQRAADLVLQFVEGLHGVPRRSPEIGNERRRAAGRNTPPSRTRTAYPGRRAAAVRRTVPVGVDRGAAAVAMRSRAGSCCPATRKSAAGAASRIAASAGNARAQAAVTSSIRVQPPSAEAPSASMKSRSHRQLS